MNNKKRRQIIIILFPILLGGWIGAFYLVDSPGLDERPINVPEQETSAPSHEEEISDEPIIFQDPVFEKAVRNALDYPDGEFRHSQLKDIESLSLRNSNLIDIADLEHFTSLEKLDLRDNGIRDVDVLTSLPKLRDLNLRGNQIEEITALGFLTRLEELNLRENLVTDISPLQDLTALTDINLRYNRISNIQPLANLSNLQERLYLNGNPIVDYTPIYERYSYIAETDFELIPHFSHPGGFYDSEFHLELTSPYTDSNIYYTLDGSEPDPISNPENTYEYTEPIYIQDRTNEENVLSMIRTALDSAYTFWQPPAELVTKSTVVRANIVSGDGVTTETATHSFFISKDYSLPVIAINSHRDTFFHEETGLFVNGNWDNRGRDWEGISHMEFFEADGTLGFSQNIGVRIHGGWTREGPQKSLRLYARSDYGTNLIFHDIFHDTDNLAHKRLILRNSGNDFHRTMFRDGLIQTLVNHLKMDTQAFQPAIVFLNGEYWGIQNIRERYDDWYLLHQYGLNQEQVTILGNDGELDDGSPDGIEHYENLMSFVRENDLRPHENYAYVAEQIDIDNFIDYYVAQIYSANTDWPQNNVRMWRYNISEDVQTEEQVPFGHDGKWRWMLFDTDYGFGVQPGLGFAGGSNMDTNALIRLVGEEAYQILFHSLIENEIFREKFIQRFSDQLNTAFLPERVLEELETIYDIYKGEMSEHIARWNIPSSYGMWEQEVDVMRQFAQERPRYQWQHLQSFFNLEDTATVQVETDPEKGLVQINSIIVSEETPGVSDTALWEGNYFMGQPIEISAVPMEGYQFAGWEGELAGKDTVVEVLLTDNLSIEPIFEEE
ncbi:CotH kinase family protein [Evansella tamaricis]|uniref:CotH kinase family protein n=1 Tax=Evansella tamaricis TaxID=2069301 RepID=A0ABS6JJ59_9BACI|nr:CotH kinase family protein [Evansella tamaricis]MBU9713714.1 CotH kinase family protein [Evansella tamaricis]